MSKGRFRVGIIGTGHGLRTILPALNSTGKFELAAVSGSTVERAKKYVESIGSDAKVIDFADFEAVSETLDLVCVASPNEFHLEHFLEASKFKTNVYLEKPVGTSYEEALKIKEAFKGRSANKFCVVGHQLRFNPFIEEIRRQWQAGVLGRVYSIELKQRGGAFASSTRPWTWEFEKSRGGGVRMAMATHLLDLVQFLSGTSNYDPFLVMDVVHATRLKEGDELPLEVDVCSSVRLQLDGGDFDASISSSAASHGPGKFEIEVLGTDGAIYYDGLADLSAYRYGDRVSDPIDKKTANNFLSLPGSSVFRKSLCEMAQEMALSISGSVNDLGKAASVDSSLNVMQILDAAMEDANSRRSPRPSMF